jgi:hypothetical protein
MFHAWIQCLSGSRTGNAGTGRVWFGLFELLAAQTMIFFQFTWRSSFTTTSNSTPAGANELNSEHTTAAINSI